MGISSPDFADSTISLGAKVQKKTAIISKTSLLQPHGKGGRKWRISVAALIKKSRMMRGDQAEKPRK